MSDLIQVEKLSKKFKIYRNDIARVAEAFMPKEMRKWHEEKWALKDISFKMGRGESLAIVGQNGSGKSTLLSILVGSRAATTGNVEISGRVSALLELGMGFDMEFTGIQNATMGLQILGVEGRKIPSYLEEVREFSELGKYFDRPLRTYSSGMQVRLAFSVATIIKPDVLVVDEALSVGDAYFQHKSIARIRKLRDAGTSLIFVSHDAAAVKTLCNRALLLDEGAVVMDSDPDSVMNYYNALIAKKEEILDIAQNQMGETRSGSHIVKFDTIQFKDTTGLKRDAFQVGEAAILCIRFSVSERVSKPTIGFSLRDRIGNEVFGTNTFYLDAEQAESSEPWLEFGKYEINLEMPLNFGVGSYSVTVAAHTTETHLDQNYDWWDHACILKILPGSEPRFQGAAFIPIKPYSIERST